MFETDDYDEVLSQFECPELDTTSSPTSLNCFNHRAISQSTNKVEKSLHTSPFLENISVMRPKRKFPGPAGILVGSMSDHTNNKQSDVEISSQDLANSQNQLPNDLFDTRMWITLKHNVDTWFIKNGYSSKVETIKSMKLQASEGTLVHQKAPMVIGFIQCIDRSTADPLITLRDSTGEIKCTLDRDAWFAFSVYLRPEQTALAVSKPTVLTFGAAHQRHHLIITLANVHALYCTVSDVKTKDHQMPDGYQLNESDEFTIIEKVVEKKKHNEDLTINNSNDDDPVAEASSEDMNFLDGLDASTFSSEF